MNKPTTKLGYTQERQEMQMRTLFFNRFLAIRYVTAGFFFMNLYWFILSLGSGNWLAASISGVLFLGFVGVAIEQVRKLHTTSTALPVTRLVYQIQGGSNLALLVAVICGKFSWFYQFLAQQQATQLAVLGLLVLGLFMTVWMQWKARQIEANQDRTYRRLKALKNTF